MTAVLGIDAAWTAGQPSGVAVLAAAAGQARLRAVAPSYQDFLALAAGGRATWTWRPGVPPPVPELVAAAARLAGRPIDVVAVDMPLSRQPICGRRAADNAVSSAFGAARCGTHSPNAQRPGPLGERLAAELSRLGFRLATLEAPAATLPAAIEVYPHPALLRLSGAPTRLPYKLSRSARYWPGLDVAGRKRRLLAAWSGILALLDGAIAGSSAAIPLPDPDETPSLAALKPYEDAIDAVVCAWVGLCFARGRAEAFGDATAAVWVPLAGADLSGGAAP